MRLEAGTREVNTGVACSRQKKQQVQRRGGTREDMVGSGSYSWTGGEAAEAMGGGPEQGASPGRTSYGLLESP